MYAILCRRPTTPLPGLFDEIHQRLREHLETFVWDAFDLSAAASQEYIDYSSGYRPVERLYWGTANRQRLRDTLEIFGRRLAPMSGYAPLPFRGDNEDYTEDALGQMGVLRGEVELPARRSVRSIVAGHCESTRDDLRAEVEADIRRSASMFQTPVALVNAYGTYGQGSQPWVLDRDVTLIGRVFDAYEQVVDLYPSTLRDQVWRELVPGDPEELTLDRLMREAPMGLCGRQSHPAVLRGLTTFGPSGGSDPVLAPGESPRLWDNFGPGRTALIREHGHMSMYPWGLLQAQSRYTAPGEDADLWTAPREPLGIYYLPTTFLA